MNIDMIKGQFKDYARSNLFLLRFPKVGSKSATPVTAPKTSLFDDVVKSIRAKAKQFFDVPDLQKEEMINLAVKTTSFPSVEMNRPEFEWRGFKMPTVGPVTFGAFEATFLIDHDMIVYHYFMSWFDDVISTQNAKSPAKLYNSELTSNIEIYQLRSDLSIADPFKTILHGAYPISISEIALSEDEAIMEFTVGFYYLNSSNEKIIKDDIERSDDKTKSLLDKAKGAIGGLF